MAFDFPASPSEGATYTPAGGPAYVFTNGVWRILPGAQLGISTASISDAPPANPVHGQVWWESDTGVTSIWFEETVGTPATGQWVQMADTSYPVPSGARNRIVNPAMQFSQENGASAGTTNSYYAADQWFQTSATSGTLSGARVPFPTPNGSLYRLRYSVTVADAAVAAGDYVQIIQYMEGLRVADFRWGTGSAKAAILRFGWKSPAGTYSFCLMNGAGNRTYVGNFTIGAAQANIDTEQVFAIPGDATGTWANDNAIGISLRFSFMCGSTYQGTSGVWQVGNAFGTATNTNGMATLGNVFEIFDVGFYMDVTGSGVPPRWEFPDEAAELLSCLRYYEKTRVWQEQGYQVAGNNIIVSKQWFVNKRTTPATSLHYSNFVNTGAPAITPDAAGHAMVSLMGGTSTVYSLSWGVIANARL
jgi:hypothetical protein